MYQLHEHDSSSIVDIYVVMKPELQYGMAFVLCKRLFVNMWIWHLSLYRLSYLIPAQCPAQIDQIYRCQHHASVLVTSKISWIVHPDSLRVSGILQATFHQWQDLRRLPEMIESLYGTLSLLIGKSFHAFLVLTCLAVPIPTLDLLELWAASAQTTYFLAQHCAIVVPENQY